MLDFSQFDRRHYPTVSVRQGYRDWLPRYEATVEDEMDLALLTVLESVPWATIERAADLGCGTSRASFPAKTIRPRDGIVRGQAVEQAFALTRSAVPQASVNPGRQAAAAFAPVTRPRATNLPAPPWAAAGEPR